jgi:hypothetical protein
VGLGRIMLGLRRMRRFSHFLLLFVGARSDGVSVGIGMMDAN